MSSDGLSDLISQPVKAKMSASTSAKVQWLASRGGCLFSQTDMLVPQADVPMHLITITAAFAGLLALSYETAQGIEQIAMQHETIDRLTPSNTISSAFNPVFESRRHRLSACAICLELPKKTGEFVGETCGHYLFKASIINY